MRSLAYWKLVSAITFASALSAMAQAPGPGAAPLGAPAADRTFAIRKLDAGKVQTPEYQVKNVNRPAVTRNWYKIEVNYDTALEWLDEATFTYYVVVKSKQSTPGKPPFTLFKGEVTYINIDKGRHKSDIYLHPSTLSRYGDVERVAVVVNIAGRMAGMEGLPSGSASSRWWEQLAPQDGFLLNRMQTPFAMINFDDYEAIKAKN